MNILLKIIFILSLVKIVLCQSDCSQSWYCALSSETKEFTVSESGVCECKCCQSLILNICSVCLETGQINLVEESDCHDYACNSLCFKMSSCESNCRYDNESECFFADLICRNFDSNFVVKTEYSNYRTVCGKTKSFFTQMDTTYLESLSTTTQEKTTTTTTNLKILNLNQSNCSKIKNKNFFLICLTFLLLLHFHSLK